MFKYCLVLVFLLLTVKEACQDKEQHGGKTVQAPELITVWLGAVDRVSPHDYVAIKDFNSLPDGVRGDSSMWSERFFNPEASPHTNLDRAKQSYHLATPDTPDLLRHEYQYKQFTLVVVESINFTLIRVRSDKDVLKMSDSERLNFINTAAKSILNLRDAEHKWVFHLPSQMADGTSFTSNPAVDPLAPPSWKERADGGIHNGVLYFLCYKKFFDLAGYRDIQRWFDDSFRAQHRHP